MYSYLVVCVVESILLLMLLAVMIWRQQQQQVYCERMLTALKDLSSSLKEIASGKPSVESNRPSESIVGKGLPQLAVAELPPEAIAPSLKRPPKPPSSSGIGVARTD